jgi:hypothetical protein
VIVAMPTAPTSERTALSTLLVFGDGRAASPAALTVGRTVVVWVRGPETRSLPPQVTGSAVLVARR